MTTTKYRLSPENACCVERLTVGSAAWETVKCHATKPQALIQLAALNLATTSATPTTSAKAVATKSAQAVLNADPPEGEDAAIWQRTYARVLAEVRDDLQARLAAWGMVNRWRKGLAIKANGNHTLIEGWAVLYGDPTFKDLSGTYFDERTDYLLDYYANAPLWYQHGDDDAYTTRPIGQRVAATKTSIGIYMKHALDPDHPHYAQTLAEANAGLLGYSTDSIFHFVERGYREADGYLSVWPLAGCSVVKQTAHAEQAEPGLGQVVVSAPESQAESQPN